MPHPSMLAKLFGIALIAATLANGAGTYLKRTGLLDYDAYRAYWSVHCAIDERALPITPRERQCNQFTTPQEIAKHALPQIDNVRDTSFQYIHEVRKGEVPLKLAKDLLWVLLLGTSLWLLWKNKQRFPFRESLPASLLAAYVALAFAVALALGHGVVAVAGIRGFFFLGLALVGWWLLPMMSTFARAVGLLLLIQTLLVPFELYRGIHLFHEWSHLSLSSRVAGTLVQPNSMGVFAVCGLAFFYCFSTARRMIWPVALLALSLVLLSGSATGILCAALALLAGSARFLPARQRIVVGSIGMIAILLGSIVLLPSLSGRENVFDSVVTGRLEVLRAAMEDRTPAQLLFGSGLGVNTNTALTLDMAPEVPAGNAGAVAFPTDSTVTGLLIQIGLVGVCLFYSALVWAAFHDRSARVFYAAVGLCSITINVSELFPINALLGLALARSCWRQQRADKRNGRNE